MREIGCKEGPYFFNILYRINVATYFIYLRPKLRYAYAIAAGNPLILYKEIK